MRRVYHKYLFLTLILFTGVLSCLYAQSGGKIDSLKSALRRSSTDTDKIKLLIGLAKAFQCEDTGQRFSYAKEALQLAEQIKWIKGAGLAAMEISGAYQCKANFLLSQQYLRKSDSLLNIAGDRYDQAYANMFLGNDCSNTAQFGKSLDYYRIALTLNSDPQFMMGIFGNIGLICNNVGDYPRALSYYDSSMQMLDDYVRARGKSSLPDTEQRAYLYMTIADVYITMLQYDKALDNYNKALALIEMTDKRWLSYMAFTGIGKAHMSKQEPMKAIEYYTKALDAGIKSNSNITNVLDLLGNAYLTTGDLPKAMEYAQSSLSAARERVQDTSMVPRIYTTIGRIYAAQKNYGQAVSFLQKAIDISRQTGALNDEKEAWGALRNTYDNMKQPVKAYDAYQHYVALRDSVYNIDKAKEMLRIDLESGYNNKHLADSLRQSEVKKVIELQLQRQRVISVGGMAGLVLVLLLSFFIYRNYSHQKKANIIISKAKDEMNDEKQKAESLLLNILPEEVARELKEKGDVQPQMYEHVTVLFTDFVNFTVASEHLTPQQLIAELHACFKGFDVIVGKYNIEKIKTVGDAYIAVSGLPEPNANHASDIIKAACEIRDFMARRKTLLPENTFNIRIGVNSGPVVAGIVGVTKFAYDIWGDTVNVAARMEQHGAEGKVNISEHTYNLVKDQFTCTCRGNIDVKNKGGMVMYFVD